VSQFEKNLGVKIKAVMQHADTETLSGKMMQNFFFLVAEAENEQRKEKCNAGYENG